MNTMVFVVIAVFVACLICFLYIRSQGKSADVESSIVKPDPIQVAPVSKEIEFPKVAPGQKKVLRHLGQLLPKQFVIVDLETTGLSALTCEIIEIGALKVTLDEQEHSALQILVKPTKGIPKLITNLTGITQAMVDADGIDLKEAMCSFAEFVGDLPIVAYNAKFDIAFLKEAALRCGVPLGIKYDCALKRARRAYPHLPNHKLVTVAKHLAAPNHGQHRAIGDCLSTAHVYLASTMQLQSKVRWSSDVNKSEPISQVPID